MGRSTNRGCGKAVKTSFIAIFRLSDGESECRFLNSVTLHVCRAGCVEPERGCQRVSKRDLNWLLPALEVLESPVSLILEANPRHQSPNLPQVRILRARTVSNRSCQFGQKIRSQSACSCLQQAEFRDALQEWKPPEWPASLKALKTANATDPWRASSRKTDSRLSC